jgi:hypothetical protein
MATVSDLADEIDLRFGVLDDLQRDHRPTRAM